MIVCISWDWKRWRCTFCCLQESPKLCRALAHEPDTTKLNDWWQGHRRSRLCVYEESRGEATRRWLGHPRRIPPSFLTAWLVEVWTRRWNDGCIGSCALPIFQIPTLSDPGPAAIQVHSHQGNHQTEFNVATRRPLFTFRLCHKCSPSAYAHRVSVPFIQDAP